MPESTGETPKRVPKRNDVKQPSVLYRNSRATELTGRKDGFVYQHFSQDPKSPGYIGKKLKDHEYGPAHGLKAMIGPWEVCHSQTDKDVRALDPRTDQGKPVDTTLRYGEQITCRIPEEEFAKYALVDEANAKERERQLHSPDTMRGRTASMTAVVMDGDQDEIGRGQALMQAGHPLPGMGRPLT
jgi:hypothetical protein